MYDLSTYDFALKNLPYRFSRLLITPLTNNKQANGFQTNVNSLLFCKVKDNLSIYVFSHIRESAISAVGIDL
jgi:hypothetical protein